MCDVQFGLLFLIFEYERYPPFFYAYIDRYMKIFPQEKQQLILQNKNNNNGRCGIDNACNVQQELPLKTVHIYK